MAKKKKRKTTARVPKAKTPAPKKKKIKPSDCDEDYQQGTLKDPIHEAFCRNFIISPSAQEAYHRTNARVTWESAKVLASRLLTKVNVRNRIMTLQEKAADPSIMSQRRALQILSEQGEADMKDYADLMDGKKNIRDMKNTRAIKRLRGVKYDVELHDSQKAIKNIGDMSGWEPPKQVDLTVKGEITIADLMKDADGSTRGLPPKLQKKGQK